jgi:hypothetical protein
MSAPIEDEPKIYLANTNLDDPVGTAYEIGIDQDGVIVYSECCAAVMSDAVARKVYEALGRYLSRHSK